MNQSLSFISFLFILISAWLGDMVMAAVQPHTTVAKDQNFKDVTIESSRVISCVILFPLDSVKFSETQVVDCINLAKIDNISYIHVIATATASGTGNHNLYLSTRRAGAIEAFINNRYPQVKVHAFGGGENPKFGKVARIFIVESQMKPQELKPGVQIASVGPPEVIERIKTKYVKQIAYQEKPKLGWHSTTTMGLAETGLGDERYRYVGLRVDKELKIPRFGLVFLGLEHKILQSNDAIDVRSTSFFAAKSWQIYRMFERNIFFSQSLELGQIMANSRDFEWGSSSRISLSDEYYKVFGMITKSNYITALGIGLGITI